MALALYFQKVALSAAQAVRTLGHEALTERLERSVPAVVFDGMASRSAEGRTALELTVNLLARLYPRIELIPRDDDAEGFAVELGRLARAINRQIDLGSTVNNADIAVAAVSRPIGAPRPAVYIGSEGWTARISTAEPLSFGGTSIPFGAAAAACLAVANVFRHFFQAELEGGVLDTFAELSLLSLNSGAVVATPPVRADMGEWHLVGSGAVGSSALWSLKRAPLLSGCLRVVDHEDLELSNLQRYVLFSEEDVGRPKAVAAEELFRGSGIAVTGHKQTWGEYLAKRGDTNLANVGVAVDSAAARVAVQASLPRRVLNAWTQRGDLGVSRHDFLADTACLACMYMPTAKTRNEDELVAEALGLADAVPEIRELLHRGSGVPRQLLERAALARGIPVETLNQFEGRPLRVFYNQGVCGGLLLALSRSVSPPADRTAETPLAFQSAFAGVLLAAEMVLGALGARPETFPNVASIDLLKRFPDEIAFRRLKSPAGRCLCQDNDFVAQYRRKHGL